MLTRFSIGKKKIISIVIALFLCAVCSGGIDTATKDVLRVQHLIKKIRAAEENKTADKTRSEPILEQEINAYIAHLIGREPDPIVRRLSVSLYDGNLISGSLFLDLAGSGMGLFFPTEMNLKFEGVLQTRNRSGRFIVHKLMLEDQPIQADMMNLIIAAVAELNRTDLVAIDQWQPLPHGIDRVETRRGAATVYY